MLGLKGNRAVAVGEALASVRPELKNLNWHVYGLSEGDLDYTVRLVREMIEARNEVLEQESRRVRSEQPERADDILDDVLYYAGVDMEYLWHFCLWRLQGIFEGIIKQDYLPQTRIQGLKAKLDALKSAGYTLTDAQYSELLDWAKLRNALSHFPPEQYRPIRIEEGDITEYVALLKSILRVWNERRLRSRSKEQ